MILCDKKLVVVMLLLAIFNRAVAMKRSSDGHDLNNPNKRLKMSRISTKDSDISSFKSVISSSWPSQVTNTFANSSECAVSIYQEEQPVDLRASLEEQARVKAFALSYYMAADSKLADAMAACDFEQTNRYTQKLCTLKSYPFGIVAGIVASDFSSQQKIKLFDKIQNIISRQLQIKLFNQVSGEGFKPLELAVQYNDHSMVYNLIKRGADPKGLDQRGEPIFLQIKRVEIGTLFLTAGVPIDIKNNKGETILFNNATILPEEIKIATWFIAKRGNIKHKNIYNQNAFQKQNIQGNANPDLEVPEEILEKRRIFTR